VEGIGIMLVIRLSRDPPYASGNRRTSQAMCRWRVQPTPGCLPALRSEVHDVALGWALSPDETQVALSIVNELVSNVIDHAHTGCRVTMRLDTSTIRIFVSDFSPAGPVMRAHDVRALHGRGMQIVAGLARQWGWDRHRRGKTVWASMDRSSS
jgi:phosphoserine phosphatase RsbU/P